MTSARPVRISAFPVLLCKEQADVCDSHPNQRENIIHVWPDVDLDEAHNHPHLLEEELRAKNRQNVRCKQYVKA